ncbi:MAG: hypothetical protein LDL53_12340 [Candidatus Hydrogenedens sp.]|nr:hypothetical protein [Candidatus Hydrogenedens sp.]
MIFIKTGFYSTIKKFFALIFLLYACLTFLASGEDNSEPIKLRSEGYAVGPSYLVRQMAIEQAQKNAIERYILSFLPEAYLNYLKPILNKSSVYIKNAKILNENTINDKATIELEVELDEESIDKDVATCLIPYTPDLPVISLLILNSNTTDSDNIIYEESQVSFNAIEQKLKNLKFSVEKMNLNKEGISSKEINILINQGLDGKKQIALSQEADVVILGVNKYEIMQSMPDSQVAKCRCILTIEIFHSEDGKLINAFSISSSVQSKDYKEGMIQTAEDCALKSIPKIVTYSFLAGLSKDDDKKNIYIYFENFKDNMIAKNVMDLLETITYGCQTEVLFESKKRIKYKLYYDGPIVHIVDSVTNNPELKNKIIIQKVLDRKIYIRPAEN